MALSQWFALRQAREALRTGQPDLARQVLEPLVQEGYRKAIQLNAEVAQAYLSRAERSLRSGNIDPAWNDLLAAERLNANLPDLDRIRQALIEFGVQTCHKAFVQGNPLRVIDMLARMKQRLVSHPDCDWAEPAATNWVQANECADRGEFPAALAALERVQVYLPPELQAGTREWVEQVIERQRHFTEAVSHLQTARAANDWREVVHWADELLRFAPQHREARNWKSHAWDWLQPDPASPGEGTGETAPIVLQPEPRSASPDSSPAGQRRFLLWIDGVGGYLVCLGTRVTFGQATANGPVDVPLYADLSRLHAELTRDEEGYVLETSREAAVNGERVRRTALRPGDRVTLGETCQFLFTLPVSVSPTARLDLVSGHRLPLAVDGVLLMAENLILGPGAQAHVTMPDAVGNVVFYRSKDGMGLRCPGPFRIDNEPFRDRATISWPCHISADTFSMTLEPVPTRL